MSEPLSAERLAEIREHLSTWTSVYGIASMSRQDIPDLLAEIDRLRAENAWLTGVVERVRERRRLGEGMQQIQFPSRWFSAAQDAHQQPGNAPRSHEQTGSGQPATTRQSDGTDPAWDGTGE